ncbi:MAG: type II secretion system GspH family protein [Candidatus Omnitrophica bacterium]|nr:type II secretion system GspH family protein [Candidatus Omnitrophota bacterium]MCM8802475.1 type II secretion system GspH family protein [Candidatus Omnitrophota bacterium]
MVKRGLTLLEVLIALFLMAIVIAGGLLLMSGNLNVMKKANELTIASALMQYMVEDVKNIDFSPIYYDNQYKFGDRPVNGNVYKNPQEIDPKTDGNDWTPDIYNNDFIVRRYDFRYGNSGNFLSDPTVADTDITQFHRVDIYILRRRGNYVLLKQTVYRSRDGLY